VNHTACETLLFPQIIQLLLKVAVHFNADAHRLNVEIHHVQQLTSGPIRVARLKVPEREIGDATLY